MELYLIRHGQSTNNAIREDDELRVSDPELTEIGQRQAKHLATYFAEAMNPDEYRGFSADAPERESPLPYKFTHLYCSAMRRALQTMQPIATALNIKPEILVDAHEIGGIFLEKDGVATGYGGMTRAEIMRDFPNVVIPDLVTDTGWYKAEQGIEDYSMAMGRAIKLAYEMYKRGKKEETRDESVAIVAHAGFISFFMKAVMNALPNFNYFLTYHNTSLTRVTYLPDFPPRIVYMNRVAHLPPELVT